MCRRAQLPAEIEGIMDDQRMIKAFTGITGDIEIIAFGTLKGFTSVQIMYQPFM